MTAQSKTVIKSYFNTGDRPTEAQFADLVDSYQNANSNLTTLSSASVGAAGLGVLAAVTTAAAQSSLGSGAVGAQIFACATTAAATNILDSMAKSTYDAANISQQVVGTTAVQTVTNKDLSSATNTLVSTTAITPVLTFATPGNLAVTYAVQTGTSRRIGSVVFFYLHIQTSAFTHTTASGALTITGLPVTVNGEFRANIIQYQGITKANYDEFALLLTNGSTSGIGVASGSGQTTVNVNASDMPTGGTVILIVSGWYIA